MAKDVFETDFEDKSSFDRINSLGKKIGSTAIERAGLIMAGVILVVVAVVMTSDISFVSISDIKDFSIEAVLLFFLSNAMYGSMYHTGILSARKLERYTKLKLAYANMRDEIKEHGVIKKLAAFCKEYVDSEVKALREIILERADVTWKDYLKYRHCSKRLMQEKGLSQLKIKAIMVANAIKPISLTADMLYKDGGRGMDESRSPLRQTASYRRALDFYLNFYKTTFTSVGVLFVGFQLFSNPTIETLYAAAIKILAFIIVGYTGYRHGYDSVSVTECNYIADQIDMLEQYKVWRLSEEVVNTPGVPAVPALEAGEKSIKEHLKDVP